MWRDPPAPRHLLLILTHVMYVRPPRSARRWCTSSARAALRRVATSRDGRDGSATYPSPDSKLGLVNLVPRVADTHAVGRQGAPLNLHLDGSRSGSGGR